MKTKKYEKITLGRCDRSAWTPAWHWSPFVTWLVTRLHNKTPLVDETWGVKMNKPRQHTNISSLSWQKYTIHVMAKKLYAQLGTCIFVRCPRDSHNGGASEAIITDYEHHSERASKNPNPEFSRINGGGSTSATSTCWIDLEMSSTENGMLHPKFKDLRTTTAKTRRSMEY